MKIAIVGKGTAGVLGAAHFCRYTECEIDWYFDDNIKPQAVGEGSQTVLPQILSETINFKFSDLHHIDGHYKTGIRKINYTKKGCDFIHPFLPPTIAIHFNAIKLQNYVFQEIKKIYGKKINFIKKNVNSNNIDADYIYDCSGKPSNFDDFVLSEYIPLNSVYVNQCYWDKPMFDYTLAIARPYGWVFGIPLKNRCSIGYLYNSNLNNLEDIKKDINVIFEDFKLKPSLDTNSFSFKNYYRKTNFKDRISYGGNSSFFLEPMEATSITTMNFCQQTAYDISMNGMSNEFASLKYTNWMKDVEAIIMLHYLAESKFNTDFWKFAKEKAEKCIKEACLNSDIFKYYVLGKTNIEKSNLNNNLYVTQWRSDSFKANIGWLNLKDKIDKLCK